MTDDNKVYCIRKGNKHEIGISAGLIGVIEDGDIFVTEYPEIESRTFNHVQLVKQFQYGLMGVIERIDTADLIRLYIGTSESFFVDSTGINTSSDYKFDHSFTYGRLADDPLPVRAAYEALERDLKDAEETVRQLQGER